MIKMLLIRGDDYVSIPKCLEASELHYIALSEADFDIANNRFRDACILEVYNRGQSSSQKIVKLKSWQDVLQNFIGTQDDFCVWNRKIEAGKKDFTEVFRYRLCIRREGGGYEQFYRESATGIPILVGSNHVIQLKPIAKWIIVLHW